MCSIKKKKLHVSKRYVKIDIMNNRTSNDQPSQNIGGGKNTYYKWAIEQFALFVLILLFNVGMQKIIQASGVTIVKNTEPFGLSIGVFTNSILVLFVTLGSFYFGFLKKFTISTLLILAGSWSNLLERILFGFVQDYIPLPSGYANLADFELWTGLILLNISIWLPSLQIKDAKNKK